MTRVTLSALVALFALAFAQVSFGEWREVPLELNYDICGLNCLDSSSIVVDGYNGDGVVTAWTGDGGEHWTTIRDALPASKFYSVRFLGDGVGYGCGYTDDNIHFKALVASTSDSGRTWITTSMDDIQVLWALDSPSPNVCYAGGAGRIFKSVDWGVNWTRNTIDTSWTYHRIQMLNDSCGWALGQRLNGLSSLFRTNDGMRWNQTNVFGDSVRIYGIAFSDSRTGVAVGADNLGEQIYRTSDGGESFQLAYAQVDLGTYFDAVAAGSEMWAVGNYGRIAHSSDGGVSWIQDAEVGGDALRAVSASRGVIYASKYGAVYRSYSEESVHQPPQILLPTSASIQSIYPNPFNSTAVISYNLPFDADLRLGVYDQTGRKVAALWDGRQTAGTRSVIWNGLSQFGAPVPSGSYLIQLETPGGVSATNAMLVR